MRGPTAICSRHESDAALANLAGFWRAVEETTPSTPMQHFIWNSACSATLSTAPNLAVHVVQTGPQSGAIAPLVRSESKAGALEFLGLNYLFEPSDFLYTDSMALRNLADALADSGTPLYLRRLPADSPTVDAIKTAYLRHGPVIVRATAPCPRIRLDESWRDPVAHLNAGRRSDLRRALRRAEQLGGVSYEILSPSPDELPPLLDEAFEVEAACWKGPKGSALARDEVRGRFFRRYAAAASESGTLRLCFLRIGGRAAAMQLAVECSHAFWLFKIGYRDEFARCSPGMLLMAETIRHSAVKKLSSYEFLGTAEDWTRVWTTDERPCVSVRAYPLRPSGVLALAADAFDVARRRLRQAVGV